MNFSFTFQRRGHRNRVIDSYLRCNFTLDKDNDFVAAPGLIFLNGQATTEEVLKEGLAKFYERGNGQAQPGRAQEIGSVKRSNRPDVPLDTRFQNPIAKIHRKILMDQVDRTANRLWLEINRLNIW